MWMAKRISRSLIVLLLLLSVGQWCRADEISVAFQQLIKSGGRLTAAEGQELQAKLQSWQDAGVDLSDAERKTQWTVLQGVAALAQGNAQLAQAWYEQLAADAPEKRWTLWLAWLVAGAAGDAELAEATLRTLQAQKMVGEKAIRVRRSRIARVGQPVPNLTIQPDNGAAIALHDRDGVALVLHFWQLPERAKQSDVAATVRSLHAEHADSPHMMWLGVNGDPMNELTAAKKYVVDHQLAWPQHYEKRATLRPLTDKTFALVEPDTIILIGPYGNIRWIGPASAPATRYALRATAAQLAGDALPILPRTRDGRTARGAPERVTRRDGEVKRKSPSDLPSDPEARKMLDQARVYLKTGRKRDAKKLLEEIVEKYPGTREAKEAKLRLEYL